MISPFHFPFHLGTDGKGMELEPCKSCRVAQAWHFIFIEAKNSFFVHFFIPLSSNRLQLCNAYFTGAVDLTVWWLQANEFRTQTIFFRFFFFFGMLKCIELQKSVDRSKINEFWRFL